MADVPGVSDNVTLMFLSPAFRNVRNSSPLPTSPRGGKAPSQPPRGEENALRMVIHSPSGETEGGLVGGFEAERSPVDPIFQSHHCY